MSHAGTRVGSAADMHLALACFAIATGGVLLGLQVDSTGGLHGTSYTSLALGVLVALFATALQSRARGRMPRDAISFVSAICGFAGLAFVAAGVLVPSGTWLFFEVLLLVWLLARTRGTTQTAGPELNTGALVALALMLLFRLWVTFQASRGSFQVVEVDVPIVSWIPFDFLEPLKRIPVGAFTPDELSFPPGGSLDFATTTTLWSIGFVLSIVGVWWRTNAALEHENDRVHATVQELPPALANLIEKLLPEEDWQALGLHGLSERMLRKRIETLVRERVGRTREVASALRNVLQLGPATGDGFASEIQTAVDATRRPEDAL